MNRYLINSMLIFCLAAIPAWAGNWLDKGSEALKSFGVTSQTVETATGLSQDEIIAGLKQALEKGASTVVGQLSAVDGFNTDTSIHIPLPENLAMVKTMLDKAGLGSYTNDVELKLNRAAEAATPKAKALFLDAISQMKFDDAKAILDGPDDAATQYFKEKMTPGLASAMAPVIDNSLAQVGAVQAYDAMMGQYKTLPFVPDVKADLTDYVVDKGMDGIFYYLAKEEKAIRENPAKRTTQLLQKVFN